MFTRSDKLSRHRLAYLPIAWVIFYAWILADSESGYVGVGVALLLLVPWLASTAKQAAKMLTLFTGCAFILWWIGRTFNSLGWDYFFSGFSVLFIPAVVVMLAIAAMLWFLKLPKIPSRLYRVGWYALLIASIAAFVIALPRLAASTGNSTLGQLSQILKGNISDSFGSNRVYVWRKSLPMAMEHPIFGVGPDCFEWQFNSQFYEESFAINGYGFEEPHNEYIQFLVDTGVLGLAAMLAFFALILWAARRKLDKPIAIAVFFAMIGFLVQAFFNFATPLAHPIVWAMWGVLGAEVCGRGRGMGELKNY
jgi:O-antigen ligase